MFETTGSVKDEQRSDRPNWYKNEEFQATVLRENNDNALTSTRRIACQLADRSDFHRKPYTPHLVHELNEDDPDRCLELCEILKHMFEDDPTSVNRIMWSDEAVFKLNGQINKHNCVYWNSENLHHTLEKSVNLPGLSVWCAISSQGDSYLDMLQNWFWPQVAEQAGEIYFQQDGAPPYYSRSVRQWLNDKFPGAWIGRRGPIEWPARSPELTPCDFFLWGFLKNIVYGRNPRTIDQLRAEIQNAISKVDMQLCQKACRSVFSRIECCIEKNGEHFENYR